MQMWILKMFFPKFMFSDQQDAFLFLVSDWMKLSTELDSRYGDADYKDVQASLLGELKRLRTELEVPETDPDLTGD